MGKKIQVSFTDEQVDLIHGLMGVIGATESEVVRGIVVSWMIDHGVIGHLSDRVDGVENTTSKPGELDERIDQRKV